MSLDKFTAKLNELVQKWVGAGASVQEKTEAREALEAQLSAAEEAEALALKAEEEAFYAVAEFRADLLDGGIQLPDDVPPPAAVLDAGGAVVAQPEPVAEAPAPAVEPQPEAEPVVEAPAEPVGEVPVVEATEVAPAQEVAVEEAPVAAPDEGFLVPVDPQPADVIDFDSEEDLPDFLKTKEEPVVEPLPLEVVDPVEAAMRNPDSSAQ